ncbi:MAG: chemotaxis protein CheW [Rhodospirillaceae bacterium]|nr:chemotaxis protein CheW [Rhodospirillales bacterium]
MHGVFRGKHVLAVGADELHSLVIFRMGGQVFAIAVEAVSEVVPFAWLSKPPRMPAFVQGILNLGGAAVPVLRLDRLLGMPTVTIGLDSSILIMKPGHMGGTPLGLLVEHVDGVLPAADFQVMTMDDRQSFQGCLAAQLDGPAGCVHLVSWEKILLEEERQRLGDFQRRAQERLAELADGDP